MKISVVVPVYGCPEAVETLCTRIRNTVTQLTPDYEIILVNDACPYGSWAEIERVCSQDPHVMGLDLSRNFGQLSATAAGMDYASGDWTVLMDCDLQDRPEGILDLYAEAQKGYDIVLARRKDRKDTGFVIFLSQTFYKIYNYVTDGHFDGSTSNLCICRKAVIDRFCQLPEHNRSFTLILNWLGFKQSTIDLEADTRYAGESSYNFRRKINLAVQSITSQSNKPLVYAVRIGFLISILSFLYIIWKVICYFFTGDVPSGWTSTIVSLYFLGGIILQFMGILGVYIGNIFTEVKHRPDYVVRTILNPPNATPDEIHSKPAVPPIIMRQACPPDAVPDVKSERGASHLD
ncbi:MAG: glycosyltransferase family 2 protein [Clostridia bacterium]|nr:glycosyltransferase family 2 protein [Clostridia bacterium]